MNGCHDWPFVLQNFRSVTLRDGPWELSFDYWEDGRNGPYYDPNDPTDEPLLRLTVHHEDDGNWERAVSHVTAYRPDVDRPALYQRLSSLAQLVRGVPDNWDQCLARWGLVAHAKD